MTYAYRMFKSSMSSTWIHARFDSNGEPLGLEKTTEVLFNNTVLKAFGELLGQVGSGQISWDDYIQHYEKITNAAHR